MKYAAVRRAAEAFRKGRMVILVDDEDRENEGDLCIAAEMVTPEAINFMAKDARGLICLALTEERLQQLDIPMMVGTNTSTYETAFTVSIEARRGVTTGISAADRAHTIRETLRLDAKPEDFVRPGHVFPLRARRGGVLVRTGQTEGVVDLCRIAGLQPAGVICEIMNDDGTMARRPELEVFSAEHDIPIISVADLIAYRLAHESLVQQLVCQPLEHPAWGPVTVYAYGTSLDARQHLVVVKGDMAAASAAAAGGDGASAPLVRVHRGYPFTHVFGDLFSRDRAVLNASLERLGREPCGVLVCLDGGTSPQPLDQRLRDLGQRQAEEHDAEAAADADAEPSGEAPPQAADNDGATAAGQDDASQTVQPPFRELGVGAQILRDLGLHQIRVLTRHPMRLAGLDSYGITVTGTEALQVGDMPQVRRL